METLDYTLIKYDALSVEAMDKIHACLDLLADYNYIERKDTLKETYENVLNIYKLDRTSHEMWELIWNHKINSLFQMEQQSGIQGIALSKPSSVNDLCVLNSVIRLMAPDKDSDTPLVMWSKYRQDISGWIKEMKDYGLTQEEIDWLSAHPAITNGICESQEGLMSLVQEPRLGGNSLTFADKCRKGIAKKQGKLFQECEDIYYENIKKNNCSETLAHYVWDVLLKVQRGYSFNRSHCLAYSLVALQEMNLAYHFPIIFWNCACLIVDSGCVEEDGLTNYDKIAIAISKMKSEGINIGLPNINNSKDIFVPDVENNRIIYGLRAIGGVNTDIVKLIESNRPFSGIKDFMSKCKLTKTAMINLIKAGAFDEIDSAFDHSRVKIMIYFLYNASEPKKKLNLQNFSGLIQYGLIPSELELSIRVFNFNKYIKRKENCILSYYGIDDASLTFFDRFFPELLDEITVYNSMNVIDKKTWDTMYQSVMDEPREWIKSNQEELLQKYNNALFLEVWKKYAAGTQSSWEMDSLCFYHGPHELEGINTFSYGIVDFNSLPQEPVVDYFFKKGGKEIPIFKLYRIAGTVIAKNDARTSITLLTTTGVVSVKMTREYYSMFKKQISKKQPDGTKKVIEKSWFKRGTMLVIQGFRRDDQFVMKNYASTGSHQLYKITNIMDTELTLIHERVSADDSFEEDEYEGEY